MLKITWEYRKSYKLIKRLRAWKGLKGFQATQWLKIKNEKQNGKIRLLSLVSKSHQDGISTSNTVPELTELIIIDSNSKEQKTK